MRPPEPPTAPPTPRPPAPPPAPPMPRPVQPWPYDPTVVNRPLPDRRGRQVALVVVLALAAVAGIGVLVVAGIRASEAQQANDRFPVVAAEPEQRSASIRVTEGVGSSVDDEFVATIDSHTRHVEVVFPNGDDLDWISDGRAWFAETDGEWYRSAMTQDDRDLDDYFAEIASGITIDEAIPPAVRPFVAIGSVADDTAAGREVRRYETVIDVRTAREAGPAALQQLELLWGSFDDIDLDGAVGVNATVWVDDAGVVWKWESVDDFDRSYFAAEIVWASTEPFEVEFPADPIDG